MNGEPQNMIVIEVGLYADMSPAAIAADLQSRFSHAGVDAIVHGPLSTADVKSVVGGFNVQKEEG